MVIASSHFYTRPVPPKHLGFYRALMQRIAPWVNRYEAALRLDPRLEYLLACKMVGYESTLAKPILREAERNINTQGYIEDPKKPGTFAEAEHRNMLYLGVVKWRVPWMVKPVVE